MNTTAPSQSDEPVNAPLMLRVDDAARLAGLGRTKFLELVYAGEIPGVVRFGRAMRINRFHLEAWLHSLSDQPAALRPNRQRKP